MRKKIVIVGAGGLGRIVHDVLLHDSEVGQQYLLDGFLDTRADVALPQGLLLKGNPLNYCVQPDEVFIPAVGNPQWRKNLMAPLLAQGAALFSYVRNAVIGTRSRVAEGSFLTPGVVISTDCQVGAFAYLDTHVILGHDVQLGDYCMVGAMSFLAGNVRVGHGVAIHPRATIAKGVSIGDGATIGIGSVVLKDVPPGATVFGNPARVIYG